MLTEEAKDKLFTPDQVAQFLQIEVRTLAKWRLTPGKGPAFLHIGKNVVRYYGRDVQQWINAQG